MANHVSFATIPRFMNPAPTIATIQAESCKGYEDNIFTLLLRIKKEVPE